MLKRIWFTVKPVVYISSALALLANFFHEFGFGNTLTWIFFTALVLLIFWIAYEYFSTRWKQSAALSEREGE